MSSLMQRYKNFMINFENGQLIGVDIGLSAVKLAYLSAGKKGTYKLSGFASYPLSEASIIDDEVQKVDEVIAAIQEAYSSLNLKTTITNLGLDGPNTVTKRLQVPDGSAEDVEDNILWEAEQYIPFGAVESELDYAVIGTIDQEEVKDVVVAAVRTDIAEAYTQLIKKAGLHARKIDLKVFALNNLFEIAYQDRLEEMSEQGAIIIDFGAQITKIIIYRDDGPILTKEIFMGGDLITEEIQKQMGISYEEAEDLKKTGDDYGNLPEEVLEIIQTKSEELYAEIKKVLNFYIAAGSTEQVSYCFITGGSARLPGVIEELEEITGLSVEVFNPFHFISFDEKQFSTEQIDEIAMTGSVALGLALRRV